MGRVVTYVVVIFVSMAVFGSIADIVVGLGTGSSEAARIAAAVGGGIGLIGAIIGLNSYYARKDTDAPATPDIEGSTAHDPDPFSEVPLDEGERAELLEELADRARPLIAQLSEEQREAAQELWEGLRSQTTDEGFRREAAAFLNALEDPNPTGDSGAPDEEAVPPKPGSEEADRNLFGAVSVPPKPEPGSEEADRNLFGAILVGIGLLVVGAIFGVIFLATKSDPFDCLPDCDGVSFSGISATDIPDDLSDSSFVGADFSGAFLRGHDLSSSHLRNADPRFADLKEANLYDADLRGANLRKAEGLGKAELTGVKWLGATCPSGVRVRGSVTRCGP